LAESLTDKDVIVKKTKFPDPISAPSTEKEYTGLFNVGKYSEKDIEDSIYGQFTGGPKKDLNISQTYSAQIPPALIEQQDLYTKDTTLGARTRLDTNYIVNPMELTKIPGTSIKDVLVNDQNGELSEVAKDNVIKSLGFKNKDGSFFAFNNTHSLEDRLNIAERGAAVTMVQPIGTNKSIDVPLNFGKLLASKMDIDITPPKTKGLGFYKGLASVKGQDKRLFKSPVFSTFGFGETAETRAMSALQKKKYIRDQNIKKGYKWSKNFEVRGKAGDKPKSAIPETHEFKSYLMAIDNGASKELTKALFYRDTNKFLISQGFKDERTRLGILNFEANLPEFVGIGRGDTFKVSGRAIAENVRFILEGGGYLSGMALKGIQSGLDQDERFDWTKSEERDQFWNKWIPTVADSIQRTFAGNNIQITLKQAQILAKKYSGVPTRAIAVAPEILGPSAVIKSFMKKNRVTEVKFFRSIETRMTEKAIKEGAEKPTPVQILAEYNRLRGGLSSGTTGLESKKILSPNLSSKIKNVAGETTAKIKRVVFSSRLREGMQLEDAAKVSESIAKNRKLIREGKDIDVSAIAKSTEVAPLILAKARVQKEIEAVTARIAAKPNSLSVPTLNKRLFDLGNQEKQVVYNLMKTVANADKPRWLREIDRVDSYMILGAAATGQIAQEFNGDPTIFEAVGMFTGLALGMTNNIQEALSYVKSIGMNPLKARARNKLERYAKLINTFDPALQEAVIARGTLIANLQDELIAQGVDPDTVSLSLNKITGLSVLHLAEEQGRHLIKESKIQNPKIVLELQTNLAAQEKQIEELRKAMLNLNPNASKGTSDFFNTIQSAIEFGERNVAQLSDDIDVLTTHGSKYYKAQITEGGDATDLLGDSSGIVDTALENIAKFGINKLAPSDLKAIGRQRKLNQQQVYNDVIKQSTELRLKYPISNAKTATSDVVDTSVLVKRDKDFKPKTTIVNIDSGVDNPSDLYAILLESRHKDELISLDAQYGRIGENSVLVTPEGTNIQATKVTADGGSILDGMFNVLKAKEPDEAVSILVEKLNNGVISKGQENKIFGILDTAADRYFERMAQKRASVRGEVPLGVDEYKSVLKTSMEKAIADKTYIPLNNIPENLQLLNFIRQNGALIGKDVRTIPLSIKDLRSLRVAFGQAGYKATNFSVRSSFAQLDDMTDQAFKNGFTVTDTDGNTRALNSLGVKIGDTDQATPVLEYLQQVDKNYAEFKSLYYDNTSEIAKLMGWNVKGGRKYVNQDKTNFQIGLNTNIPTREWLDFDKLSKMPETQLQTRAAILMSAVGSKTYNSSGELVGRVVQEFLPDGTPNPQALAVASVLETAYAEFLANQLLARASHAEITKSAKKLAGAFKVADKDGTMKSLLNWEEVLDSHLAFSDETVSATRMQNAETIADSAITESLRTQLRDIKQLRSDIAKSQDVLKRFAAMNQDAGSISNVILSGGEIRLDKIKEAIKLNSLDATGKPTMTDEQINNVLRNVVADELDFTVFRRTGNYGVDVKNGTIYPKMDMDIENMKALSGYGNPESVKAKAFKKLMGDDRAKFYDSMIEFIEISRGADNAMLALRNASRAFSLESYISRFYSIQRGVVSMRYVATEAILQQYRLAGASTFKAMLNDPEAGQLFLDILKSGKTINAKQDKKIFRALVTGLAAQRDTLDNIERRNQGGDTLSILPFPNPVDYGLRVATGLNQAIKELGPANISKINEETGGAEYPEYYPKEIPNSGNINNQMSRLTGSN